MKKIMNWFPIYLIILVLFVDYLKTINSASIHPSRKNLTTCPEYAILYNGRCYCDSRTMTFKFPDGHLHCIKCLQCPKCQGTDYRCDNGLASPYPYQGKVNCSKPEDGKYVKHETFVKCHRPCTDLINEIEVQICGCEQNRKCDCAHGFYRDEVGNCKLLCSKCPRQPYSFLKRVPIGSCESMPYDYRCKQSITPTKSILTNASELQTKADVSIVWNSQINTLSSLPIVMQSSMSIKPDGRSPDVIKSSSINDNPSKPTNKSVETASESNTSVIFIVMPILVSTLVVILIFFGIFYACKTLSGKENSPERESLLSKRALELKDLLSGLERNVPETKIEYWNEQWKEGIFSFFKTPNSEINRNLLDKFTEKVYEDDQKTYGRKKYLFGTATPVVIFGNIKADKTSFNIRMLFEVLSKCDVNQERLVGLRDHLNNINNT